MKELVIGKRLHLKIQNVRIEIIIGVPTTVCKVELVYPIAGDGRHLYSIGMSICSEKDEYNWRKGVIKALQDAIKQEERYVRNYIFLELFDKYPELREV